MIRGHAIAVLDLALASYGMHVRRKRARKLSIESLFGPATCERLLVLCNDDVELARQAIRVAMFTNDDPGAIILDMKEHQR